MTSAADLLRESISDLKGQFSNFVDKYHTQIIEIWRAIERIETKQKTMSTIYGLLGGAIPATVVLAWILINNK